MSTLAAIHVGRRQLGLDEETYRGLLARVTGKLSAKDMSEGERLAVVREMRRCGFKTRGGHGVIHDRENKKGSLKGFQNSNKRGFKGGLSKAKKPRSGLYRKLQALWIAGWNLGVVRDRTDAGLDAFIRGKCGGVEVQAVEALKGWISRETPVDWGARHYTSDEERVAAAQWLMLCELSAEVYRPGGFMAAIQGIVGRSRAEMRAQDWHDVMNELGARLRHLGKVKQRVRSDGTRGGE